MAHSRRFRLPVGLFLLSVTVYAPLAGRYFVSEDFLILRRLTEGPWLETLAAQWTGPWLETTVVLFYRPVASMILLGEVALFGLDPHLLILFQVLVHGVCGLLVFGIARRLLPEQGIPVGATVVAGLFVLYPLHPNTVVWIASFVNLYAAAFLLAAVWLYLEERRGLSLLSFALALGCYEAAAVLPLLVVACDLALEGREEEGRSWRKRLRRWGPYFALPAGYLLLRGWALDSVVGGYPQTRERLTEAPLEVLGAAVASPMQTLAPLGSALPLWGALLGSLALLALAAWQKNRVALLGLGWTVIAQAPFGFVEVVPGNGRFRYLAAFGMALAVVALILQLKQRRMRRWTFVGVGVLVGAFWLALLIPNLGHYAEAGRLSRRIQGEIVRASADAPGPVFLTRYPTFVHTASGAPAAQVFTWGLRDSVAPPFTTTKVDLYPLPPLGDAALLAVAEGQPEARILVWDAETQTARPFHLTPALQAATAGLQRYEALEPAPDAVVDPAGEILLPPGVPAPTALLLAGASNPHHVEVVAIPDADGRLRIPLPTAFLKAQAELYDGVAYWWLETRGAEGRLLGYTPMRWLETTLAFFNR